MTPRSARTPLAAVILITLWGSGCGPNHAPEAMRLDGVEVHVQTLAATPEPAPVDVAGTLRAAQTATLAARVMGTVTEIRKAAGEPIRKGEVLLVIDPREVTGQIGQAEGALAQARAASALAETNYQRFELLESRGSASRLELDQARYQRDSAAGAVAQAEGALAAAQSYRSYAEVAAPFDGRVVDRLCEVGDLAAPGRPLLAVEDARRVRLHLSLPEGKAGTIDPGAPVEIRIPELGDRAFSGTVSEVVPAVDVASRSFLVKVDLPEDPALRAGLFAHATLQGEPRAALRVPPTAVVHRGSLTGAFVEASGRAAFRLLLLAEETRGSDEPRRVLSGLAAGDRLILDPPATLEEGATIEVQE